MKYWKMSISPTDTWSWIKVGLTLVYRLRRWTTAKPNYVQIIDIISKKEATSFSTSGRRELTAVKGMLTLYLPLSLYSVICTHKT